MEQMANKVGETWVGGGVGVMSAMAGKCNAQRAAGLHRAQQGASCKAQLVLYAMRFRVETIGRDKDVPFEGCCGRVPAAGPG